MRPVLASYPQIQYPIAQTEQSQEHQILQGVNIQLDANLTLAQLNEHFKTGTLKGTILTRYHV